MAAVRRAVHVCLTLPVGPGRTATAAPWLRLRRPLHGAASPASGSAAVQARRRPTGTAYRVPFQISEGEAVESALEQTSFLTPRGVRRQIEDGRVQKLFLPFWGFDATVYCRYKGQIGRVKRTTYYSAYDKRWKTRTYVAWTPVSEFHDHGDGIYTSDEPVMQVYASYDFRRENLAAVKGHSLQFKQEVSRSVLPEAALEAFKMDRRVAWEVARDGIRAAELAKARAHLRELFSADHAQVEHFILDVRGMESFPVYLPAFLIEFEHHGRVYRNFVDGVTGEVSGQIPKSPLLAGALAALPPLGVGLFLGLDPEMVGAWAMLLGALSAGAVFSGPRVTQGLRDSNRADLQAKHEQTLTEIELDAKEREHEATADKDTLKRLKAEERGAGTEQSVFSDPKGLYRLLGLSKQGPDATIQDIRAAFRSQALLIPDSDQENFDRLHTAYRELREPVKRSRYDAACRPAAATAPAGTPTAA